jgi:hypothetical protein
MSDDLSSYIFTPTQVFLPEEISSENIILDEIIGALVRAYRFGYQSRLTVMQHSVGLAKWILRENPRDIPLARFALFHDASEAYLLDIPRPLRKFASKEWFGLHDKISKMIYEKFNVEEDARLWRYDKRITEYELETFYVGSRACSFSDPLTTDERAILTGVYPSAGMAGPIFRLLEGELI